MADCPFCSNTMVRHIQHKNLHWFCRHCWQNMPVYDLNRYSGLSSVKSVQIKTLKTLPLLKVS